SLDGFKLSGDRVFKDLFRIGFELVAAEEFRAVVTVITLIEQNLRDKFQPFRQRLREIDTVEIASLDSGETGAGAEQVAETIVKAEASAAELLVGSRALLDGLIEDHHAESALSGAPLWREHAQIGASLVAGPVRDLIEFHVELQIAVARIENPGDDG